MESPLDKALAEWTEEDVARLITNDVQEGQRLDYKEALPLKSRSERDEAAKDTSGMANATGGWLIFGVAEKKLGDGRVIPSHIEPITDGSTETRLADVIASSVIPRLNMETRQIPVSGGYVVVCRIHQRAGALHMVQAYNDNRYYVRTGMSTRPMGAYEIEQAFAGLNVRESRATARFAAMPVILTRGAQPGCFRHSRRRRDVQA